MSVRHKWSKVIVVWGYCLRIIIVYFVCIIIALVVGSGIVELCSIPPIQYTLFIYVVQTSNA